MSKNANFIVKNSVQKNIEATGPVLVRLVSEPKVISNKDADFKGTPKDNWPWADEDPQIGIVFGGIHGEGTHPRRLNSVGYAKPEDMTEDERQAKGYEVKADANGIEYLCKKTKNGYVRIKSKARTEQAANIYSQLAAALGAEPGDDVVETLQEAHNEKLSVVAVFKKSSWDGKERSEISYFRAPTEEELENNAVEANEENVKASDV